MSIKMPNENKAQNCKLCTVPNRKQIEEEIAVGTLTKTEVARDLMMNPETVYDHIMNHMVIEVKPTLELANEQEKRLRNVFNKRDILFNNMLAINERLEKYLGMSNEASDYTQNETAAIVKLAAEVRRSVMALAELEGELRQEQQITLVHFNELKAIVLRVLPEDSRQTVLAEIMKLSVGEGTVTG